MARRSSVFLRPPLVWSRVVAVAGVLFVGAAAPYAWAEPTVQQLQTMYDDALRQLQQSQDRKNELANENEQLKGRLTEMEQQLRTAEAAADPSYAVRARAASWEAFLVGDPALLDRFNRYDAQGTSWLPRGFETITVIDDDWPFTTPPVRPSMEGPATRSTTEPTTETTTEPTTDSTTVPATEPVTVPAIAEPTAVPVTPSTQPQP